MKKKNLLMTAVAVFGLATISIAQTVPSYVPTSGLVGWWPFTGNANDLSINGNNGTVNGATLTSDRNSNINSAYNFDGANDKITINHNSAFIFTNFTISCWGYKDNQSLWYPGMISKCTTGNFGWYLVTDGSSNVVKFQGAISSSNYFITQAPAITPFQWVHFVCTFSPNLQQLYVNGILISTGNNPGQLYNANDDMYFGFKNGDGFWGGKIDDIGIWNRALTQAEISALYNGCTGTAVTTQPINQSVNISSNAQFTTASSDSMATYQWQTDLGFGYISFNSIGQYSGTANDTLTIVNTTLTNNNQPFRCIVSSCSSTDTSAVAILTVVNNVGINEISQSNLFSVYPNPANSHINVKADVTLLGSDYTIYDNTGKLVLSGKINSENTVIELGNLSGGIYMFNVGGNLKQTFKVIKE
jgi:hypothetical protein